MKTKYFLIAGLTALSFCAVLCEDKDYYKVLGLEKSATQDQIRKVYKNLAREWHPDKNKDEGAEQRFMEIAEAYEVLGDETKRREYDHGSARGHQWGRRGRDASFFRDSFHFQFHQHSIRDRITNRVLENKVIPESKTRPYFFFATTDFCFPCMRVEPIWRKFIEDLDILGLPHGQVDVDLDSDVTHRLHVTRIPAVGAVVDGRSILFDSTELSPKNLREFTRKVLNDYLVTEVTDENIESFLSGWFDNKPRVLFFANNPQPTLRYLAAANLAREQIVCGFLNLKSKLSVETIERYDVPESSKETLLVFHEYSDVPVKALSENRLQVSEISKLFSDYKYLSLPRLARQQIYDDLCPVNQRFNTRFCAILTLKSYNMESTLIASYRNVARRVKQQRSNINLLYLYTDYQKNMMEILRRPSDEYKILVMARRPDYEVVYDWLDWQLGEEFENQLDSTLEQLSQQNYGFTYRSSNKYEIRDEYKGSLGRRIMNRLYEWWDYITYTYFDGDSSLTMASLLSTIVCLFILIILINIMSNTDKPNDKFKNMKPSQAAKNYVPRKDDKFTVYDLRHKNYDKLIKDAKRGHRMILLMISENTKSKYLTQFATLLLPYSRAPYLAFGFIYIDKYLIWYQKLLKLAVGDVDNSRIRQLDAQSCVGTVLAINGYRKYFNIYHPKTIHLDKNSGEDFLGMGESSDEEESDPRTAGRGSIDRDDSSLDADRMLAEGRLLDGLTHWMDRLIDGALSKCKIERWPIFPLDINEYATSENPNGNERREEEKKDK